MKRIFCNNCNGETHHVLRAKYCRSRKVALDEDGVVEPRDVFAVRNSQDCKMHDFAEINTAIWSCAGCEEETFEWEYVETDPDGNRSRRYFPERLPEPENGPLSQRTFQKLDAVVRLSPTSITTACCSVPSGCACSSKRFVLRRVFWAET